MAGTVFRVSFHEGHIVQLKIDDFLATDAANPDIGFDLCGFAADR